VGRDVLEGRGLGGSEGEGVSVHVRVAGCAAVSVIGRVGDGCAVSVGRMVSTRVAGMGVMDVNVQASDNMMLRAEKRSFRLIRESVLLWS
jgi:hypothetical protein